jgi:hypothetical protein
MEFSWSLLPLMGLMLGWADQSPCPGSFLYQPAFCMDYALRLPAEPYDPQPGDIFLATGREWWAKIGHWMAGTGAPQHSGIVFASADGRMMLLEAGPHNTFHCRAGDLVPQLASYEAIERVWIRRRKVPLTPEQSARLTAFAVMADGKRFAFIRMVAQAVHLRCRGPLLDLGFGLPHGERYSYFCAELVGEACVAGGLLDADATRPAAMYPRDFFFGRSNCAFVDCRLDMEQWYPPARWTPCPGTEACLRPPRPYLDGDAR